MRRRPSPQALILALAAAAAVFLTIFQRSPEGLIGLGVGEREVRAAPGAPTSTVESKYDLKSLRVVNQTLIRIRDSYVDPARIEPKKMLYGALDSVQFNIPEVLIDPDEDNDKVTVVVNDKKRTFDIRGVDSPWRLSSQLKEIVRFIEGNMNPGADLAEVEYAAVNGMLSTLDPHSVLLDPETAREMDVSTQGHFGGLGIVIGMRDKRLTVLKPMEGTPAHQQGIKKGDHIVKIESEITENLTLQESVNRMRGKPGSSITLWVERDGHDGLLKFEITRDIIRVPSVKSKLLSSNVGYIKIEQFAGRTAKETKAAMRDLRAQGARGWVLDLRRNPGGLLEQAILVSDLFVDSGTLVTTVSASGKERDPRQATRKGTDDDSPVVVLVNGSSASASEIVAGALKNLDRAVILGSKTFGKGSVQILYDNPDSSKLKLTIAQYLTPGNLSIQGLGIVPDIELDRMLIPDKNEGVRDYVRLLRPSRSYGEKDLKASLRSRYAKNISKPVASLGYVYESDQNPDGEEAEDGDAAEDEDEELSTDELKLDYEMELARDIIAASTRPGRKSVLGVARRIIERRRRATEAEVTKKLGALGIDWSAPPSKAATRARLKGSIEVEGDGRQVRAGSKIKLIGTVTNTGSEPAYRVQGRIKSLDNVFSDREMVFGRIDPGQSKTWTVHVKIPDAARDRLDRLEFKIREARKASAEATPLKLRIVAAERPTFSYSHQLIDEGNGDGLVQSGESFKLRVTIKNTGPGVAKDVTTLLRNASGDMLSVKKARFELGELKPGAEMTREFAFSSSRQAKDRVVVELTVYDSNLGESVVEKLKYPVRSSSAGPQAARGAVEVIATTAVYEGASTSSARIATAPRRTVFAARGRLGSSWVKVDLGGGRPGFVPRKVVRRTSRSPSTTKVSHRMQVTPPKLSVKVPSYETSGKSYRLLGKVSDDSRVADFYIYVSNREAKIENRKVYYQSNRGGRSPASMDINATIPLWPGSNAVTIVARENGEVQTSHTLYLYRRGGNNRTLAESK